MLSFLHSFPTYPSAIRTVVTAVVYMALQAGYLLSLQYSYYYRWNVRHSREARTLTTLYRGPWRARAVCASWKDVLILSQIPRAPHRLFGVSSRAICLRPVWSAVGPYASDDDVLGRAAVPRVQQLRGPTTFLPKEELASHEA